MIEYIADIVRKSAFLASSPNIPVPSAHQSSDQHTQERTVDGSISALITVGPDMSCFAPTVRSVLCQTVLPAQLVIAVCVSSEENSHVSQSPRLSGMNMTIPCADGDHMSITLVVLHRALSFGDCINRIVRSDIISPECHELWLLHDDSRPHDSEVLKYLSSTLNRSPSTYLVGAKQVGWRDDSLQSVGYFIDRFGHRVSLVVDGQEDQGQYDSRQDVFGVSLAGALISYDAFQRIGGADPWYGTFGESYDISRKIWRCGGRVVVEPQAVIAHRRSRFEGIRSADGRLFTDGASDSYAAQVAAREKLAATQIPAAAGPFVWLYSILDSLFLLVRLLIAKEPFRALCELGAPWVRVFLWGQITAHRIRLRKVGPGGSQFDALIAHHEQLRQWRTRQRLFEKEKRLPPVNPLGRDHLHHLALVRARWVLFLAVLGCGLSIAANWPFLHALVSGASLTSDGLVPTGARLPDVWSAASLMYSTAWGLGAVSAPLPFHLVLVLVSCCGLGNLAAGISVWWILFLPLALMSFFALAGTVTRSNAIRFIAALAWGAGAFCCGIPQSGHLPLSFVWVFLPLAFFFVLRAVGRYAVDRPLVAYASIQAAAIAGLCMAAVALCEPQMAIALMIVFIAYLVLCKGHRAMLLLIPVPAIVVLAPTFFSMLVQWRKGLWRQLFDDAMLPDASSTAPDASWMGAHFWRILSTWLKPASGWTRTLLIVIACCAFLIVVAAFAGLFVPRGWRISRMMWMIAVSGVLLALVAPRIAIQVIPSLKGDQLVGASPVPGMSLILLGMIMAACSAAGLRDSQFSLTTPGKTERIRRAHQMAAVRTVWTIVGSVLSIQAICAFIMVGAAWSSSATITANHSVLPLIAQRDLVAKSVPASPRVQRILAITPVDETHAHFTVLSTSTGDILDRSATLDAASITSFDPTDRGLGNIVAQLMNSSSPSSIAQLSRDGFVGIFIPPANSTNTHVASTQESTPSVSVRSALIAHIQASDGTIPVVSNASGVYVRLEPASDIQDEQGDVASMDLDDMGMNTDLDSSSAAVNTTGINTKPWRQARTDPQRIAWLIVMGVTLIATCMLAIPRSRRLEREVTRTRDNGKESEE